MLSYSFSNTRLYTDFGKSKAKKLAEKQARKSKDIRSVFVTAEYVNFPFVYYETKVIEIDYEILGYLTPS